jgi:endogenous inhibitor of DNA gyrase (YacG/DUF329 family)
MSTATYQCYTCNIHVHPADTITPDDIHHFCSTRCYTLWNDTVPDEEAHGHP